MSPSLGESVSPPGVSGSCAATACTAIAGNEDWRWEQTREAAWEKLRACHQAAGPVKGLGFRV